jgi:hypothetical protein
MTDLTDFITNAFKTIARAAAEAGVNADLFKAPELIQKTLKRRVSAELKRLAVLLRRLIFLMALQVELAPVKPRPGSNYFEKTEDEAEARKAFFSVLPFGFPPWADHCADARTCACRIPHRPLGGDAGDAEILQAPGEVSRAHDPELEGRRRSQALHCADLPDARHAGRAGHRIRWPHRPAD